MKKLPDFDNAKAMAAFGRRQAIMDARRDACSEFRDIATAMQSIDVFHDDPSILCQRARHAIDRIEEISGIARHV